jgi:hypothetical protein
MNHTVNYLAIKPLMYLRTTPFSHPKVLTSGKDPWLLIRSSFMVFLSVLHDSLYILSMLQFLSSVFSRDFHIWSPPQIYVWSISWLPLVYIHKIVARVKSESCVQKMAFSSFRRDMRVWWALQCYPPWLSCSSLIHCLAQAHWEFSDRAKTPIGSAAPCTSEAPQPFDCWALC